MTIVASAAAEPIRYANGAAVRIRAGAPPHHFRDDHIHDQTLADVALRSIAIESLPKELMLALHIGRIVKLLFTVSSICFRHYDASRDGGVCGRSDE